LDYFHGLKEKAWEKNRDAAPDKVVDRGGIEPGPKSAEAGGTSLPELRESAAPGVEKIVPAEECSLWGESFHWEDYTTVISESKEIKEITGLQCESQITI